MTQVDPISYAPSVLTAAVIGTGLLLGGALVAFVRWTARQSGTMRALAAATNQAVVRRDRQGRWRLTVDSSDSSGPTYGQADAPPEQWRASCHPEDRAELERWLAQPHSQPLRFRLVDGEEITVLEAKRAPLENSEEELLVWRDLTTSERLATRVKRHEQVQRALIDNLADMAVFVQPVRGGVFTTLCLPPRFADLFQSEPVPHALHEETPLPPFTDAMRDAIGTLRDRVLAVASHSAAIGCEAAGRQLQLLGTLLGDGALEEADLLLVVRDAGPDARRANRLETAAFLSGGVVHDLNNLLNMLVMHAELGRERAGMPTQAALHFERISVACQRATELTSLMRRYLRRDPASAAAQVPLRVAQAVEEAVDLMRPSVPRSVRIDIDLDQDATIAGEAVHLHQVVSNLLMNAVQALTGRAGARIQVRVTRSAGGALPTPTVQLVVEDNGPGIAPELRARCFEPFFTTKPVEQGTGLGLAVVHAIVNEALGGTINVQDAPEGGASFTLHFPALPPSASVRAPSLASGRWDGASAISA